MKKFGLDTLVRNEVMNTTIADPIHHEVCVKLVELANKFNERDENGRMLGEKGFAATKKGIVKPFPMTYLVYFAVGKEAHKQPTFNKGYNNINEEKALTILRMLKYWGKYNNNTMLSRNDKVVHAVTKYYEKVSPKFADFKNDVQQYWKPWGKAPKTMKEITLGLHIDCE